MPGIRESRFVPWSALQMFGLVADVRRYPEFLPWVIATRVRRDDEREMVADMLVGFDKLRETFTSLVHKRPPHEIAVEYVDGPMRRLENSWKFTQTERGGCRVDFCVDFEFRNAVFEKLAGQYFDRAFRKMVSAFETRADSLYGNSNSSANSAA
ncbi:MAG: type II toxin-antitoxin system RatA family toxin [Novosphingobium sp.]